MAQAYAQFRGVMTVELGSNSQAAFSQFTNQADRAGRAGENSMNRFNRSVDGLEGRLRAAGAGIGAFSGYGGRLASQFNAAANAIAITGGRVGGLIAALAGGTTLLGATADIQNYTARLKAATSGQAEFNSVYADLLRVSSATRSDLGETINFYTRLKLATTQLGLSQGQLAGVIQTVQQSIRLSGAGAQEANAALIQFVQGISSANGLSGDEFKSLGENATVVLRNIAQGLKELNTFPGFDGTISSLRKLGSEGKLTADVVVPALQQVAGSVEENFARLPPTIDQASTALRNGFLDLIVRGEQATGALSGIASAMIGLSKNLDTVAIAAASVAGIFAARLVPLAISVTGALFNTAAAVGVLVARNVALSAGMTVLFGATTAATGGLATLRAAAGGLIGLLGGPWAVGLAAAAGAVTFLATRQSQLSKAAETMGTSEDALRGQVNALTESIFRQNAELERNAGLKGAVARQEARERVDASQATLGSQRAALAGAFVRANRSLATPVDGSQFFRLLNSGADISVLTKEIVRLTNASSEFAKQINVQPGAVDRLFGNKSLRATLDDYGAAQTLAKQATGEVIKLANSFDSLQFNGAAIGSGAGRTLKEVTAAAKEGVTPLERYREAKIALDKEFGVTGEASFAKLSSQRQAEYQQRLTQIEQTRRLEIEAEKSVQDAKRQGAREDRQNRALEIRALNAIARDLPDSAKLLQDQITAANEQAKITSRIRQEDFARLATLDLQLQGEEATAEVLRRAVDLKRQGFAIDADTLAYLERQVEGEARRNVAIERRAALLAVETRALGQIQAGATSIFGGDLRGGLRQIGDAFRQQLAQRLSLNIFGDVEREAQLANTGALDANTSMVERLIVAMDNLGVRITEGPGSAGTPFPTAGGVPANDNRPGSPVKSLETSARALTDVSKLFRDDRVQAQIRGNGLGAFGARAGGTFGVRIGETLDRVFGRQSQDAEGRPSGFAGSFGKIGAAIGAAQEGSSAADAVTSILDEIGLFDRDSKSSRTGRRVGGIGGAAVGFALGGPLGAAVGTFIGNIVGSTIGAAFKKNPFGDVALSSTASGVSGSVFNSRGAGSGEQALTLAQAVDNGLSRLAQGLGLNLRSASLGSIGFSGEQFFFNPTGGDFKAAGNQRFGTAEEAVTAAIRNAVNVGAFDGLREGSKRLLLAGADINEQAQKAADFEGVFRQLRQTLDPAGAAVEDLNRRFTRLRDLFAEAGANAEEYGKLQQLYDLQRAQALEQANSTLRDFLTELTTSSSSGLSVRDRQAAAEQAFAGFRSDIEAGRTIDQAKFRDAAQTLLDVNRELFGSQTGFFDTLGLVTDLTRRAISTTESQQSLPDALRLANQPVTNALGAVQAAIEAGFANLEDALMRSGVGPAANDLGGNSIFTARQDNF